MPRMGSGQARQPVLMGLAPGVNRAPDTLLFALLALGSLPPVYQKWTAWEMTAQFLRTSFVCAAFALLGCCRSRMERIQKLVLVGSAITRKELRLALPGDTCYSIVRRCRRCWVYDGWAILGKTMKMRALASCRCDSNDACRLRCPVTDDRLVCGRIGTHLVLESKFCTCPVSRWASREAFLGGLYGGRWALEVLERDRLVKGSPGCPLFRNDERAAPLSRGISQPRNSLF